MLRSIFIVTFFICYSFSFAQTTGNDLFKIETIAQAEMFIQKNPKLAGKLFTIELSNDTTEFLLPLYTQKPGFTFRIGDINYKILQMDSTLSFRVNYIYLNGQQLSKDQIDSLRQEIISKYKAGASFFDLAREYNMDGNVTGNTGWFSENMMVKEFENAVRAHKKGDIFTVDTPSQNWYHVVLKTYSDTYIKKLKILKVKSS